MQRKYNTEEGWKAEIRRQMPVIRTRITEIRMRDSRFEYKNKATDGGEWLVDGVIEKLKKEPPQKSAEALSVTIRKGQPKCEISAILHLDRVHCYREH